MERRCSACGERPCRSPRRGYDLPSLARGSKWAVIEECAPDTALRDINELVAPGGLPRSAFGGRSTADDLRR